LLSTDTSSSGVTKGSRNSTEYRLILGTVSLYSGCTTKTGRFVVLISSGSFRFSMYSISALRCS
jgi:hypothetical protein